MSVKRRSQARYRPYPAYRDSGVEWLGEVPEGWEVVRLKTIARARPSNVDKKSQDGQRPVLLCNYVDVYKNDFIVADMDFMSATAADDQVRDFQLRVGDVLVTKDSETADDIAVPALVEGARPGLVCGYHLTLIRPLDGTEGAYLFRAFQAAGVSDQFRLAANGVTRFGLPTGAFTSAVFPLPPLPTQRAIAAFLDRETAKIDALVAKKERLLELLDEKRTALISHAVTKGLDPDAPMKDSGVEWLGEVPEGWEVVRLMVLTEPGRPIMYGIVLPGPDVREGVPIVKGGDVGRSVLSPDLLNHTSFEIEAGHVRSRLERGDLVYAIRGSIGEVASVPPDLSGANLTQDAARISVASFVDAGWLRSALKAGPVFSQLDASATGATIRGINIRDLKRVRLPLPPLPTQRAIATFLDRETAKIDVLKSKIRKAIDLLKEYRTALISAAVTGKIDVREVA